MFRKAIWAGVKPAPTIIWLTRWVGAGFIPDRKKTDVVSNPGVGIAQFGYRVFSAVVAGFGDKSKPSLFIGNNPKNACEASKMDFLRNRHQ